jgi:hypothetical protein
MYRRKVSKFGLRKLDCIKQRVEIGDRVVAEVWRKHKSVEPEAGLVTLGLVLGFDTSRKSPLSPMAGDVPL